MILRKSLISFHQNTGVTYSFKIFNSYIPKDRFTKVASVYVQLKNQSNPKFKPIF